MLVILFLLLNYSSPYKKSMYHKQISKCSGGKKLGDKFTKSGVSGGSERLRVCVLKREF